MPTGPSTLESNTEIRILDNSSTTEEKMVTLTCPSPRSAELNSQINPSAG